MSYCVHVNRKKRKLKKGKLFFNKILLTNFWQSTSRDTSMDERNIWCNFEREQKGLVCWKTNFVKKKFVKVS